MTKQGASASHVAFLAGHKRICTTASYVAVRRAAEAILRARGARRGVGAPTVCAEHSGIVLGQDDKTTSAANLPIAPPRAVLLLLCEDRDLNPDGVTR